MATRLETEADRVGQSAVAGFVRRDTLRER
jgi:hypothetical protein